jgi:hypothetical protein
MDAQLAKELGIGGPVPAQVYGISESREIDEVDVSLAEDLVRDPVLAQGGELGFGHLRHAQILPKSP